MVAALSQGIVDESGRVSRTSMVNLFKQLEEFDPSRGIEETFEMLVQSPELRKSFLDSGTFEAKALSAVQNVFSKGTSENAALRSGLKTFSEVDAQTQYDNVVAATEADPAAQAAMLKNRMAATAESIRSSDESGGMSGIIRDGLDEIRNALGKSGFGSKLDQIFEDFQTGGVQDIESAISALGKEKREISHTVTYQVAPGQRVGRNVLTKRAESSLSREEIGKLNALTAAIAGLEQLGSSVEKRRAESPIPELIKPDVDGPAAEAADVKVDVKGGDVQVDSPDVNVPEPERPAGPEGQSARGDALPLNSGPKLTVEQLLAAQKKSKDEDKPEKAEQDLTIREFTAQFPELNQRFLIEQSNVRNTVRDSEAIESGIATRKTAGLERAIDQLELRRQKLLTPDTIEKDGKVEVVPGSVTDGERIRADEFGKIIARLEDLVRVTESSYEELQRTREDNQQHQQKSSARRRDQ